MKLNCNIIDDLLPLYLEEICSADSKAAVEEHLQECSACGEKLARMKDSSLIPDEIKQEHKFPIADYAKKVKRHRMRVGTLAVLISVIAAFFLSFGLLAVFSYFHVDGKEIAGVTTIDKTCEAGIIRHDLLNDAAPQEYVLEAPQIEQLKQLLLESSFTRRLRFMDNSSHAKVSYSIYIFFNERQDVLLLDCLGGDFMLVSCSFDGKDPYDLKINNKDWQAALENILQSAVLV